MSSGLLVRMAAPVLGVSVLLLAAGVVAAWHVHRMQRHISEVVLWNASSMRAAEEVEIDLREVCGHLDRVLLSGERRHLEAIPALRREMDHWLAQACALAVTPQEKEMMTRATRGYARFFERLDRIARCEPAAALLPRVRRLVDEGLSNEILQPVHEYLDYNEEQVETSSAENRQMGDRLVVGLLLLGACGAGAGLLAGYGIARGISRSIVQLSVPVRDAAGKLDQVVGPVTLSAGWGFRELEGALRQLAGQVGTVVERLQQSRREALRAEQLAAVGQLAAGMAHELRNPLMAMKILVQAAAERDGPPGLAGRDLAVLEDEITRLEGLVRAFLNFARPPELHKRTFDARRVLEQTVGLVSARAAQQGVRIACEIPDEPVLLEADVGQARQVLLNLLLNALDALPSGGSIWVQVRDGEGPSPAAAARPAERSGDLSRWVTIRVADDGRGLPAELGDQIFEPFISTKETGIGLGLSICKRIAEAHGGRIAAGNRPEGGAVFSVRLPRPAADDPCPTPTTLGDPPLCRTGT